MFMLYLFLYTLGEVMALADSNITKRALASALKELMETEPFAKISVGDICEKCEMNRKSFYYHFKDKYELVNWIYHTEFIAAARRKEHSTGWDLLEDLCEYFDENREFYRKSFRVDGQDSFSDYFRDIVVMMISSDMEELFGEEAFLDFYVEFYADAFVCAIKKWLLQKESMPAGEFSGLLKACLLGTSSKIARNFSETDIL